MRLPLPPEYLQFLAPYPVVTQELAVACREALIAMLPDCVEVLWDATNTVGMGYGFTEKTRDHFIHLPAYTKYVNLGFAFGSALDDPEGRLQGSGARIRHTRISRVEDLHDPYVQDRSATLRQRRFCYGSSIVRAPSFAARRPRRSANSGCPR